MGKGSYEQAVRAKEERARDQAGENPPATGAVDGPVDETEPAQVPREVVDRHGKQGEATGRHAPGRSR